MRSRQGQRGHLGLGVLGGSSPAGHEPWCSTDLRDVQGLGSTGQMPVLGGGEGQAGGVSALGGFHTPLLPSLGCTRGWGGCCPESATGLPLGCL